MLCSELFCTVRMAILRLWIFTWSFTLLLSITYFWFMHYKKKKEKFYGRVEARTTFEMPPHPSQNEYQVLGRTCRERNPHSLLVRWKQIELLWRSVWRIHRKLKNRTTMWPSYSLPGKYPKNSISLCSNIYTFMVNCWSVLQYHKMEPTCPSTDE